ncbi:MAG TPA: hypothetical protein VKW77_04750 [Acidimicrobiales bacterium]|nr:hypothetical protein [Acidimicrobiales bacterium]
MTIQSQLEEIAVRLARATQELQVAREQVAFQTEVSDDAQVRMVVSGTPLADREYREARDDLERLRRHEERTRGLIAELNAERDQLLDRLLESIESPADIMSPDRGRRGRRP